MVSDWRDLEATGEDRKAKSEEPRAVPLRYSPMRATIPCNRATFGVVAWAPSSER